MKLTALDQYIIAVDLIGFLLFAVSAWLYKARQKSMDGVLIAVALAGGSLGLFVSALIFDRGGTKSKHKKDIMLIRVITVCLLVIQTVAVLMLKGFVRNELTFDLLVFFKTHYWLPIYLIVMNIIAFAAFGIDKRRAVKDRPRIRIVTLLTLAFAGGSVGALLGMSFFRHKTKQSYFCIGVPLMLVMQLFVLFYLMNIKFP